MMTTPGNMLQVQRLCGVAAREHGQWCSVCLEVVCLNPVLNLLHSEAACSIYNI